MDSEELFVTQISVHYETDGPEFIELTDSQKEKIKPLTCSEDDADWSFDLT